MAWFQPAPLVLPQMIMANGQFRPEHPALVSKDGTQSWADFSSRTAQVASALLNMNVTKGQRVAVLMDNSAATVETLFGIVRAGAVTVPLNVSISDDAVANMIDDSQAVAVIVSPRHQQRIDSLRGRMDTLMDSGFIIAGDAPPGWISFEDWVGSADPSHANTNIAPDDECNIIYSSGTTGLPKGIVHTHRCRAAWAYDMAVGLRYHSAARTLLSLGLYSNISWVAMLSTTLAGGTMVLADRFDAGEFIATVEAQQISHSVVVPVQLQRMLAHPSIENATLDSLQSLMCCGSPLSPSSKRQIVRVFGDSFFELYGLTEGLVTILPPEDMGKKLASVGRACPGQEIQILSDDDRPCTAGEAGEIVGRGPLLMAEYHDRPEATRDATWEDRAGERWLRTGDIGRMDEDGYLYLVDRKKDMILSGGQNIYPADIEAIISQHEDVVECAVIGVASEQWGETPLAVLVANQRLELGRIQAWINERTGKQQRVAGVVQVDELPRNPNGKVLKRELRDAYSNWQPTDT